MFNPDNSGRTAITRTSMSAPAKWLLNNNKIHGRIIDYGCGRGKDVEILKKKGYNIVGYDKNHEPDDSLITQKKYDTIICNYVFNVIGSKERQAILNNWESILDDGGIAYIAVRRDYNEDYTSSNGVTQYCVELPYKLVVERKGAFAIYMVEKDEIK